MKRVLANVEYDTETATLIERRAYGRFGDADGYEECLYQTPEGKFFFYRNGGPASKFPTETIKRVSAAAAQDWRNE